MARPPSSLPPTKEAPLQVTLLLGSFKHAPEKIDLFDLHVPASHPPPVHPEEASFHPLPPIAHTFRPEQVLPPKYISAVFAGAVLTPWVVLLALVRPSHWCYRQKTHLLCFAVEHAPTEHRVTHHSEHILFRRPPRGVRSAARLVLGRPQARAGFTLRGHTGRLHRSGGQTGIAHHWKTKAQSQLTCVCVLPVLEE
jgi:hypothetical protein